MFDAPKSMTYVAPAEPIDTMQRYLVRVVDLNDLGLDKYAPADKPYNRIRWIFRLGTPDGLPVLDVDGNPFEHHDYTSSKTSKGKMTSKARMWMEAFLGVLEDAEIDAQIVNRLKNQVAVALFEITEPQDGSEGGRLQILKLAPYEKGTATAARAEQDATAERNKATIAAARQTRAPAAAGAAF